MARSQLWCCGYTINANVIDNSIFPSIRNALGEHAVNKRVFNGSVRSTFLPSRVLECERFYPMFDDVTKPIIFNGNDEQAHGSLGWKRGRLVVVTFTLFPGIYNICTDIGSTCTSADLMDELPSNTSNEFSREREMMLWKRVIMCVGRLLYWGNARFGNNRRLTLYNTSTLVAAALLRLQKNFYTCDRKMKWCTSMHVKNAW